MNPFWNQSGTVNDRYDITGDGSNLTLVLENFNYQGMDVAATDLSAMDFLHLDVWVPVGTDRMLKVTPINGGTGPGEVLVEVPLAPGLGIVWTFRSLRLLK